LGVDRGGRGEIQKTGFVRKKRAISVGGGIFVFLDRGEKQSWGPFGGKRWALVCTRPFGENGKPGLGKSVKEKARGRL